MRRGERAPSREGTARIAIVGAATSEGGTLRAELARRGVPGGRVDLYGSARGEAVLSEYGGEARLIQEPEVEEIARQDVVFLCETSDAADRILRIPARKATVIDLTGRHGGREGARLVHHEIAPLPPGQPARLLAAPHPIAVVLAELLHPLHSEIGVLDAVAVVLRPAADFGESGIEELREQTMRLLRFERLPTETFGQQLAFNLIPQSLLVGREGELERRVAAEVSSLLGWERGRLAVRLVTVPVFLGHAICLRLRLEHEVEASAVAASVGRGGVPGPPRRKPAKTPLAAPEERRTDVSEVVSDGTGGFWIWAIAGEAGVAAAAEAVLAAAAVADL